MQAVLHCEAVCAWQLRNRRCKHQADQARPERSSSRIGCTCRGAVNDRGVRSDRIPVSVSLRTCPSPLFLRPGETSNFLRPRTVFGPRFLLSYFIRERRRWSAQCVSPPSRLDAQLFIHTATESGDLLLNLLRNSGWILPVDFSRFRENTPAAKASYLRRQDELREIGTNVFINKTKFVGRIN